MGTSESLVKRSLEIVPYVLADCSRIDLRQGRAVLTLSVSQGAIDSGCHLVLEVRKGKGGDSDPQPLARLENRISAVRSVVVLIEQHADRVELCFAEDHQRLGRAVHVDDSTSCDDGLILLHVLLLSSAERHVMFERTFGVFTTDHAWLDAQEAQYCLVHDSEISLDELSVPWYAWPKGTHVHVATVSFRKNDAVSTFALGVFRLLMSHGIPCSLYADACDIRLRGVVKPPEVLLESARDRDVVLFNFSIFDAILPVLAGLPCKKILYYHGITPPELLRPYNPQLAVVCEKGYEQLPLVRYFPKLMANSHVSARILHDALEKDEQMRNEQDVSAPYRTKSIAVCPPIIGTKRLLGIPADPVALGLTRVRLLYVGRLVPHKKVEDLLAVFDEFHRLEPDSSLLLVGPPGDSAYSAFLDDLLSGSLSDLSHAVRRLGEVSDGTLKSLYAGSTAFLTMTEHEGFCVPLVEAMAFDLPVFAFAEPAVAETLGDAGHVFASRDFAAIAKTMHRVLSDDTEREAMLARQRTRLASLEREADGHHIWQALEEVVFSDASSV